VTKAAALWIALGWAGFAILPWYFDDGLLSGPAASGLVLGLTGGRPWLLPLIVPLLLALIPLLRPPQSRGAAGAWMIATGMAGLLWLALQGFAIDHRGWSAEWIADLFGTMGPKQGGIGYGAFLLLLASLMLLCHGLAARGFCGGDAFTVSALGLILAVMTLFVFFPIAKVLAGAFEDNAGHLALANFSTLFFDRSVWGLDCVTSGLSCGVAWNSLFLALVVALGSTALGLACALIVTRSGFPFKGTLRALTVLPIITPPFVIGLAIILLFGRAGAVTTLLSDWFGVPRSRWIYGWPGVCVAQLLAFAPIAFLVLIGVVQGISPSLEEAAQTLRARRWTIFSTVSLPLMRPGIANAFLLSFVESLADFGNPLVLGGNFEVLSTKIFYAVVGSAHDRARAAVLAIILLAFTLGVFYAQHRWLGRRSYTSLTGKGDAGLPATLPRAVAWFCYGIAVPWLVLTVVTYATILIGGLVTTMGRDYTLTLRHYLTAFSIEPTAGGWHFTGSAWDSLWTTIEISAIAAPLTTVLGLLTAYLLSRRRFAGRRAFEFATMLSFAIPGTVVGVAYILAFNVPPIELTGTGLILVICFIFRNMPVGVRAGIAAMSQIDRSLDEASLMLRARSFTTLRRITMPLLRPAIVASLVYAFVRAMTSVSAIIFLVSAEYNMATAYIVGRVEAGEFGLAIAYSSILILIMLGAVLLIQLLVGERRLGRRPIEPAVAPVAVQAGG
jgi:iron(III) transport system permease protein